MSSMFHVALVGGPRDGEVIESRMPPFEGSAYTITEGRYVVLGEAELGSDGAMYAAAYFEPHSPPAPTKRRALGPELTARLGQASMGAIAGIMWAGVLIVSMAMFWVIGWALIALLERVSSTLLITLALAAGAVLGAIAGWYEQPFDPGGET